VNYISSRLLVICGKELKATNFKELCLRLIGRFTIIVDFFECVLNTGIMLCNMLTFNDFLTGIFNHDYFQGQSSKLVSSKKSLTWIILPNLLILPFVMRKKISDTHLISIMLVCMIVLLAFFAFYLFLNSKNHVVFYKLRMINVRESPSCFSLLLFGYMSQQEILEVYGKIKGRKIEGVKKILNLHILILTSVYISIALFGYLTFYNHKDIKNNNIFAFDVEKSFFYVIINLFVSLSVLFSNVTNFHPTVDIIVENIEGVLSPKKVEKGKRIIPILLQILLILTACTLELYDMNFLTLIDFLSVFISPMICIYLPLLFYIKLTKNYSYLLIIVIVVGLNCLAIYPMNE
jgi:amino acid permease